jgi:hypothetical protein
MILSGILISLTAGEYEDVKLDKFKSFVTAPSKNILIALLLVLLGLRGIEKE